MERSTPSSDDVRKLSATSSPCCAFRGKSESPLGRGCVILETILPPVSGTASKSEGNNTTSNFWSCHDIPSSRKSFGLSAALTRHTLPSSWKKIISPCPKNETRYHAHPNRKLTGPFPLPSFLLHFPYLTNQRQ